LTLACVTWFGMMVHLGSTDYLRTADHVLGLSAVQQAIIIPPLLFLVAVWVSSTFATFVRTSDLTVLVGLQVARILALSHVVSWGYGLMAGGFALPVATGNLVVCVFALSILGSVASRRGAWQAKVYVLTIIGLLEFLMTIALAVFGFFTAVLPIDPPTAPGGLVPFTAAPLSLFPTYAIPAFIVVHIATLIALRYQARTAPMGLTPGSDG
jgi:hypothetical protein